MAEQMSITTGSFPAEPVDSAPEDNMQEAPAEQAQDKKDGAPEKLNCDSSNSDSGSGSEKDSVRCTDHPHTHLIPLFFVGIWLEYLIPLLLL